MSWVRLDDEFAQHPKVAGLSDRAFRAHVTGLVYCGKYETDGRIPANAVKQLGFSSKQTSELVAAKLWKRENGSFWIHDYLSYNPSKEALEERRRERSASGKRGATARWGDRSAKAEAMAQPMATAIADAKQELRQEPRLKDAPVPSPGFTPSSQGSKRTSVRLEQLPDEKQRVASDLIAVIGDDADDETANVVVAYANRLPEGALAKVLESVKQNKPRNRAAYVVKSLVDEVKAVAAA